MASRFVYYFGNGVADGGKEDKGKDGGHGSGRQAVRKCGF